VRLPFRHTGNPSFPRKTRQPYVRVDACATFVATVTRMTNTVTESDTAGLIRRHTHDAIFAMAEDGRKLPIRRLRIRNRRYCMRLNVEDLRALAPTIPCPEQFLFPQRSYHG
jgi:hypothetical protein